MALRPRVLAWLLILGPAALVFCALLLRGSFYVAITVASGLGVAGLSVVACVVAFGTRRDPGSRQPGSP
jgi:hypothetical protein